MLLATLVVSFILTVIGIPAFIRFYQRAHISGQQMHEDVKQHQAKAGTPTMGGVVFLITSVFVTLVFSFLTGNFTRPVQLILFILVLYGIVGFLDPLCDHQYDWSSIRFLRLQPQAGQDFHGRCWKSSPRWDACNSIHGSPRRVDLALDWDCLRL